MEENNQKTISKPIKFDGIGLHSGVKSTIRVLPSPKNSGISFKRIDLKENNFVEANIKNVSSAKLCTTIKNKHGVSVSTIEHLLGAFYMTGLDNALVEISNIEVPIMDGSSKDFINWRTLNPFPVPKLNISYMSFLLFFRKFNATTCPLIRSST